MDLDKIGLDNEDSLDERLDYIHLFFFNVTRVESHYNKDLYFSV